MKKRRANRLFKALITIALILLSAMASGYYFLNPYLGSTNRWDEASAQLNHTLTKEQAFEELAFIKNKIATIHYSAINGSSDDFLRQYQTELENMPGQPSMLDLWLAGSRMLHTLGDGHSTLYANLDERIYRDMDYHMKDGALFLRMDHNDYRVWEINGVGIEELKHNAYKQLSYENELYRDHQFVAGLKTETGLRRFGSPDFDSYTVQYEKDGTQETASFDPSSTIASTPLEWVSYTLDQERNLAVFTLRRCRYNEEYKSVLHDFFREVKTNGITNIAVDLRDNPGGSSLVANEFITYLNINRYTEFTSSYRLKLINGTSPFKSVNNKKKEDFLFDGNVYILTSPSTFSSAMWFSVLLQDNGLARVVGEPCGNKPSSYGEVVTFMLPYSRLYFSTTFAYFERPDKTIADQPYQMPDYQVPSENALDKVLELIY